MKKLIAAVTINGGPDCTIETGKPYDPKKHKLPKDKLTRLIGNGALIQHDDGESEADAAARDKADAKEDTENAAK